MSAVPTRLTAVTIGARDVGRLRKFYTSLGWQPVQGSDDNWSGFLLGGALLALYPLRELAAEAEAQVSDEPDAFSGVTFATNVDSADAVDEAFRAAVAAGATPVAEPTDRQWGGRSAYFADPEGNRWELAWAPGAAFDERGGLVSFG